MNVIRCSSWTLVVSFLLLDIAPAGSCGRSEQERPVQMRIVASDCACATGVIQVTIDGRPAGEMSCGPEGLIVTTMPGTHSISATNEASTWPTIAHTAVAAGNPPSVEIGCPRS